MTSEHVIDSALAMLGGDRELLEELSGIFLSESPAMLDAIREALAASDARRIDQSAHTMAGTLASLGAAEAAQAARTLEIYGRHNTLAAAPAALAELEKQVAVVTHALGDFIEAESV